MSAVAYLPTPEWKRLADRRDAIAKAVRLIVPTDGLSSDVEPSYWQAVRRRMDILVEQADAAMLARQEFEAHDERINQHVRTFHTGAFASYCPCNKTCPTFMQMDRKRERLLRASDELFEVLQGGSR